jgi:hypothetical protein
VLHCHNPPVDDQEAGVDGSEIAPCWPALRRDLAGEPRQGPAD